MNIEKYTNELELNRDGILYSPINSRVSFPDEGNENCFEVEDTSFWFKHRNNCIIAAIKNHPPALNEEIFDVGGGNGFVSRGIQESGFPVVLVEPGKNGAKNAKKRGIKNIICSTLQDAKFKKSSLSAVGAFDVVEHIENDVEFLREINQILVPSGKLYITVPAYQFLWSFDDEFGGHHRRYTISNFTHKLCDSGFEVEFATYFFRFLPLPILLLKTIPHKFGIKSMVTPEKVQNDHSLSNSFVQKIIQKFLRREISNIENEKRMSFGGSCLIVARKKTDMSIVTQSN
ncbi:MAG: class I SAM-dependent methyltransferase [Rhabdochlamydiaceae bacterium]